MDDDLLNVNCGRCGRPVLIRIEDLRDKRTVDCLDCQMSVGGSASSPSPVRRDPQSLRLLQLAPETSSRKNVPPSASSSFAGPATHHGRRPVLDAEQLNFSRRLQVPHR